MVRIVPSDRKDNGNQLRKAAALPSSINSEVAPNHWRHDLRTEQIRLIYSNAGVAAVVTILVSSVLAYLQWGVISHKVISIWLGYMILDALGVLLLNRRFQQHLPSLARMDRWGAAFLAGSDLSAGGWGVAGVLLYPEAHLAHQLVLAFVIGGMMLGSASILASRAVASFSFPLTAGLPLAVRFLLQRGEVHTAMGLLILLFTASILITAWHLYQTVTSSLLLRFENRDLLTDLQLARQDLEALNRELEQRVQQRTAELDQAVFQLQREIAERQHAEEERARAEASLRQAQKLDALGVMAAGIAHDFNNLLTSIAGYTTLARETKTGEAELDGYLEEVLTASSRAANLVRRLLVFSRKTEHRPEPVPVAAAVAEALKLVQTSLPPGITLRQSIHPECGCVFADPDLIHQIIMNLCVNAREAMARKGGRLDVILDPVQVSATSGPAGLPDGAYVRLAVRDTGPGVPSEIAERIFEPFFTTKAAAKSSGLGLSVVHGIVKTYGGCVNLENPAGGGAAFIVFLPRLPAVPIIHEEGSDLGGISPRRILFVDDEAAIARLGALMLRRLGHTVTSTANSATALRLFTREPAAFDLLITDLTMPKLNGIELIQQIKRVRPNLAVILTSGFNDPSVGVGEAGRIGIGEFLPKPFSPSGLAQAIRKVFEKSDAK